MFKFSLLFTPATLQVLQSQGASGHHTGQRRRRGCVGSPTGSAGVDRSTRSGFQSPLRPSRLQLPGQCLHVSAAPVLVHGVGTGTVPSSWVRLSGLNETLPTGPAQSKRFQSEVCPHSPQTPFRCFTPTAETTWHVGLTRAYVKLANLSETFLVVTVPALQHPFHRNVSYRFTPCQA